MFEFRAFDGGGVDDGCGEEGVAGGGSEGVRGDG